MASKGTLFVASLLKKTLQLGFHMQFVDAIANKLAINSLIELPYIKKLVYFYDQKTPGF